MKITSSRISHHKSSNNRNKNNQLSHVTKLQYRPSIRYRLKNNYLLNYNDNNVKFNFGSLFPFEVNDTNFFVFCTPSDLSTVFSSVDTKSAVVNNNSCNSYNSSRNNNNFNKVTNSNETKSHHVMSPDKQQRIRNYHYQQRRLRTQRMKFMKKRQAPHNTNEYLLSHCNQNNNNNNNNNNKDNYSMELSSGSGDDSAAEMEFLNDPAFEYGSLNDFTQFS